MAALGLAALVAGCSQSGGAFSGSGPESNPGETITTGGGSYTRVEPAALRRVVDEGELPATDRFIPYAGSPAARSCPTISQPRSSSTARAAR